MKPVLLIALLLAACAQSRPEPRPVALVPQRLRACPAAIPGAVVPPKPRTLDSIVAYANETEKRRAETAHAFEVCRARLIELLHIIGAQ